MRKLKLNTISKSQLITLQQQLADLRFEIDRVTPLVQFRLDKLSGSTVWKTADNARPWYYGDNPPTGL